MDKKAERDYGFSRWTLFSMEDATSLDEKR